jgi:Acetyltransferase (GNAT) domain
MSAVTSLAVQRQESRGEAESYYDSSLLELSSGVRLRLQRWKASHWMSSLRFAESYCYPPAQRVSYITGPDGEILEACFYREGKWGVVFKSISLTCLVEPESNVFQMLVRHRFTDLIRAPFLPAAAISQTRKGRNAVSFRQFGEDYSIELPRSTDQYLRNLGSTTRKHLPYYLRRLKKEWGTDWRAERACGPHIAKQSYLDLLALNRLRMDRKKRRSLWTEELAEHRWKFVCETGCIQLILHGDRVVAGTLSFVHDHEAYLVVIAHDPEFDRLNLGNICLWMTIEQLIVQGFSQYHLLWGNSPYKEQFGAVSHPLYQMTLFTNQRTAIVWRAAEVLGLETMWRRSKAVAEKVGCLLTPSERVRLPQSAPK